MKLTRLIRIEATSTKIASTIVKRRPSSSNWSGEETKTLGEYVKEAIAAGTNPDWKEIASKI